ncbi:hypothetical protein TWF281_008480 [Arthrobotrys megalospora]
MDITTPPSGSNKSNPNNGKALFRTCYQDACETFRASITNGFKTQRDSEKQQIKLLNEFLQTGNTDNHSEFDRLQNECKKLAKEGEHALDGDKADKLLNTLNTIKTLGDGVISMAPETVSIVWFGISSMLTVATIKLEIRLLICDTCESITSMVEDCLKWEILDRKVDGAAEDSENDAQDRPSLQTNIWESGVTKLLLSIFDFLWHAQPHRDPSRLKRLKSTIKEAFTKDLQQKVDKLLEAHEELVKLAHAQFQELLLENERETRARIVKIREDLKESVSIASRMLEGLQCNALYEELKAQRDKISESKSHKLHFESLNDRASIILGQRKGHVANWFFEDPAYQAWVDSDFKPGAPRLLCLESPRGHGKSTAMLCLRKKLSESSAGKGEAIVLYFFFKKGDQDIQNTRTALQSIVYQLLTKDEFRNDVTILSKCVELFNPTFGKSQGEIDKMVPKPTPYDFSDIRSLCETIRQIGDLLPRVYLLVDALDECQDRIEKSLVSHLMSVVRFEDTRIRLILSVRNTVDIKPEMILSSDPNQPLQKQPERKDLEDWISQIVITSEKNSSDLKAYLTHDIDDLLGRRIDRNEYAEYYAQELQRIVDTIHQKANGDFALARMIIANLQQPSKLSLEDKILRLPAAIGEIYMTALESLKTEEQELVVTALKWVVWGVSALTVVEISDHYREIYRKVEERSWNARPPLETDHRLEPSTQTILKRPKMKDPREEPEVKEVIHHLETIGRDFFRIDKHTGIITVDISIREWIQEDSKAASKTKARKARGFDKYRDEGGYTVFKFTLTPSFVRYGDSLMELFDEKEAQMSITLDILRTLNDPNFQAEHMPWEPEWIQSLNRKSAPMLVSEARSRYEIEYWQDHLKILGNWWSEKCLDDPYWADLLIQLSIFTQPENWYRWVLQPKESFLKSLRKANGTYNRTAVSNAMENLVSSGPIQIASRFGLNILIDNFFRHDANDGIRKSDTNWFCFEEVNERIKVPRFAKLIKDFQRSVAVIGVPDVDVPEQKAYRTLLKCPIQLAVHHPSTVECLVGYGAEVNTPPWKPYGSILLWALGYIRTINVESGNIIPNILESARILIRNGARLDADVLDDNGVTLLHQAAGIQDLELFKLICFSIDWDGLPETRYQQTPLHFLFSSRPRTSKKIQDVLDICQILVQLGSKYTNSEAPSKTIQDLVNAQDGDSQSPLMGAVKNVFVEGIAKLIELGVDIHDDDYAGNTCFHKLAGDNDSLLQSLDSIWETADLLYEGGLDIGRINERGETAFLCAFKIGTLTMTEWLLKKFGEPQEQHNFTAAQSQNGGNVLHLMSKRSVHADVLPMIQRYIPESVIHEAMNRVNKFGQTPLMLAAKYGFKNSLGFLRWLLDYGVDPELAGLRDQYGRTTLDYFMFEPRSSIFADGNTAKELTPEEASLYSTTFWQLFEITPIEKRWTIFNLSTYRVDFWQDLRHIDPEQQLQSDIIDNEIVFDEHNWTVKEIINACARRKDQVNRQPYEYPISPSKIPGLDQLPPHEIPSRFVTPFDPLHNGSEENANLSGNGLCLSLPLDPKFNTGRPWVIAIADHPVPPNRDFYFEATFSIVKNQPDAAADEPSPPPDKIPRSSDEWSSSYTSSLAETRVENRSRVGLVTRHRYLTPLLSTSILPESIEILLQAKGANWGISYDIEKFGSDEGPSVELGNTSASNDEDSKITEVTVGIGINTRYHRVCFTLNGKRLPDYYPLESGQYFPMISLGPPCKECTINFGSSPFVFEFANSASWEVTPWISKDEAEELLRRIFYWSEPPNGAVEKATELIDLADNESNDPDNDSEYGSSAFALSDDDDDTSTSSGEIVYD